MLARTAMSSFSGAHTVPRAHVPLWGIDGLSDTQMGLVRQAQTFYRQAAPIIKAGTSRRHERRSDVVTVRRCRATGHRTS